MSATVNQTLHIDTWEYEIQTGRVPSGHYGIWRFYCRSTSGHAFYRDEVGNFDEVIARLREKHEGSDVWEIELRVK